MKKDRISTIYQNYFGSNEYNQTFLNLNLDLSWLKEKLTYNEMKKLENSYLSYVLENQEKIFKSGFVFAWELFQECSKDDIDS